MIFFRSSKDSNVLEVFRLTFSVRRKLLAARTLLPSGEDVELPGTSGIQRLRSVDESGKRAAREDEEDEDEDEGEGEGAPSLDGSRAEDTGLFESL